MNAVRDINNRPRRSLLSQLWHDMMTVNLPHLKIWALLGAAVVITAASVALVMIVWHGGWPETLRDKQLMYLGISLIFCLGLIAVVVVTLASARLSATGAGGFSINVDADGSDDASASVSVRGGGSTNNPAAGAQDNATDTNGPGEAPGR